VRPDASTPRYWSFADCCVPPSRNRRLFSGVDFVMGAAGFWQLTLRLALHGAVVASFH
jgi:hypothetical protein